MSGKIGREDTGHILLYRTTRILNHYKDFVESFRLHNDFRLVFRPQFIPIDRKPPTVGADVYDGVLSLEMIREKKMKDNVGYYREGW